MYVSHHTLTKFERCPAAWYAYAVDKVELAEPRATFDFGSLYHALIAEVLKLHARGFTLDLESSLAEDLVKAVVRQLQDEQDISPSADDEALAHRALNVLRYQLPLMKLDEWETLEIACPDCLGESCECGGTGKRPAVELDITVPWVRMQWGSSIPSVDLRCKIDWVARHKPTSLVYVIDHKTTSDRLRVEREVVEFDPQLALYRYAVEQLGVSVDRCALHFIANKVPSQPKINKAGKRRGYVGLSAISTDWPTLREAIEATGDDPNAEVYTKLRENAQAHCYHKLVIDATSDKAREAMLENLRETTREIARVWSFDASARPRRSRWCGGCDYNVWCGALLDGDDPRALLHSIYRARRGSPHVDAVVSAPETLSRGQRRLVKADPRG